MNIVRWYPFIREVTRGLTLGPSGLQNQDQPYGPPMYIMIMKTKAKFKNGQFPFFLPVFEILQFPKIILDKESSHISRKVVLAMC